MPNKRQVTKIWRHRTKNLAMVEYSEADGDHLRERMEKDSVPPTQGFHDAFDKLAVHIAAPYLIAGNFQKKVVPQEIVLDRVENVLRIKRMKGHIDAEGFEGDCKLSIPQQIPDGDLKKVVAALIKQAEKYIDGARGQVTAELEE